MTKHESPMIQWWRATAGIPGVLAEELTIVRRQPPVQVEAGAAAAQARILTTTVDPVMAELADRYGIAEEVTT